ncbi:PEP-CTERM sorting domain-containing protein [Roseateles sp. DXS20W]|uniref:PEP-CTERM sorting domain-containing protein n=1 Tax=Pelomonas lactea TaxID=3299030 RepID=A0ABW7GKE3_9BURK
MKLHRRLLALALLGAATAQAADGSFGDAASFLASAGSTAMESFENQPGRRRELTPIDTPLFTIGTTTTPIGVQVGPDAPSTGFGAHAVGDGSRYLSVYLAGQPQGPITFQLAAPATAFGLYLVDVGETSGQIIFKTNAGAFSGTGLSVDATPQPDGGVRFLGFTQTQAFTQVTLTVTGIDEAYGVDQVYVSAVPEPASALLMSLGLAGLLAARRRR